MAPIVRKQAEGALGASLYSADQDEKLNPWRSKSCNNCRKKKTKCDSVRPTCGSCKRLGHDCSYSKEDDGRRPASKHYVESLKNDNLRLTERTEDLEQIVLQLQNRVKVLEEFINNSGFDASTVVPPMDEPPGTSNPSTYSNSMMPVSPDGADSGLLHKLSFGIQTLKLEDNGELFMCSAPSPWLFKPQKEPHLPQKIPPVYQSSEQGRHVLCVNGSSTLYDMPCVDWNRHLPRLPGAQLTRVAHDRLLHVLWTACTSWCMRVVPELFLRDMYTTLSVPLGVTSPRTAHYSPFLHNAMLALATAFTDDPYLKDRRVRKLFADKAKSYLDQECHRPTLGVKQGLFLLSSYHSGNGDYRLGYMYFGMGLRIADALGLSMDCSDWVLKGHISEDTYRDRVWSFWNGYVQDKTWALFVGTNPTVPSPAIPLPPLNSNLDMTPWSWNGSAGQPSHMSITFIETCKLFMIGAKIMESVYGLHREDTANNEGRLIGMQRELDEWLDQLPDQLRINRPDTSKAPCHVIMLNLTFAWLVILLNRPFYRIPARFMESIKRCNSAAERCLTLLRLWKRLYGLRYTPHTAVPVTFAVGTAFLLAATQESGHGRVMPTKKAFEGVQEALQNLREMAKTWESAKLTADMLENLVKEYEPNYQPLSPAPSPPPAPRQPQMPSSVWSAAMTPTMTPAMTPAMTPMMTSVIPGAFWSPSSPSVWSSPVQQGSPYDYNAESFIDPRILAQLSGDGTLGGGTSVPFHLGFSQWDPNSL